jgi:hypothetical protein
MAEKKPEHNPSPHATATHAGAPMTYAQAQTFRLVNADEERRQKELEQVQQKRAELKDKAFKKNGYAYYIISQPYYREGQTFPAKSIVRVPQDEEPSVTWQPLERETATAEPPLTTAGQMNEPVRKPTAPFTSEVYEKTEPNTETNPPGKDGVHNQDGKKRPSDRNL